MTEHIHSMTNALQVERHRRCHQAMRTHVGALISHGTPLYAIAQQQGLPNLATLRRWLAEDADLRSTYEQAHALREEYSADDAVMLADTLAAANNTGLKLRIDARKWGASLNRKDGKKTEKDASAKETLEHLQRALERVRKEEEKEIRQRYATGEAEDVAGDASGASDD